jgi:hypothetical protein
MPVQVRFDPTLNSPQLQIIPDASATTDGVMSKEQAALLASLAPGSEVTVLVPLDSLISAPTLGNISTGGGATLELVVPAGMTKLKVSQGGPRLMVNAPSPVANLVPGALAVATLALAVLTPGTNGIYDLAAAGIHPGDTVVVFARVSNVYATTQATAPTNEWSIEFKYSFAA